MKMSAHQRMLIEQANDMGYFPTLAQARKMSRISCDSYVGLGIPLDCMDRAKMRECDTDAIKRVMEGGVSTMDRNVRGATIQAIQSRIATCTDKELKAVAKALGFKIPLPSQVERLPAV